MPVDRNEPEAQPDGSDSSVPADSPDSAHSPVIRCVYSGSSSGADEPSTGDEDDLVAWYAVERPRLQPRPWTALNMVTSIDGSVAVDGASGALGNATDRRILAALRAAAGIIVVGAGTAQREGYGPPRKAGQRIAVVTNSGQLDPNSGLFTSGAGLAITNERADIPEGIEVLRAGETEVDLADALRQLSSKLEGLGWAIIEGGPSLNGALLDLDLIDEINVTTAPMMVGGAGQRMATGARERVGRFELVHQLIDSEQYVFSRWVRRDLADRRLS